MAQDCNHQCEGCSRDCGDRKNTFLVPPREGVRVRRVIAVESGKGGVGKSLVTCLLAAGLNRRGHRVGVLDGDITGPSIPRAFGLSGKAESDDNGLFPMETGTGIRVMSTNLLLDTDTRPVIWRGPVIAGLVRSFWTDVAWGELDFLLVDMPPGTGDVPLTVFQSLPVAGTVLVTTPQTMVGMIVEKAAAMTARMGIPILGLVENESFYRCPECGTVHYIFGDSHPETWAADHGVPRVCRLPIRAAFAAAMDAGTVQALDAPELAGLLDDLEAL